MDVDDDETNRSDMQKSSNCAPHLCELTRPACDSPSANQERQMERDSASVKKLSPPQVMLGQVSDYIKPLTSGRNRDEPHRLLLSCDPEIPTQRTSRSAPAVQETSDMKKWRERGMSCAGATSVRTAIDCSLPRSAKAARRWHSPQLKPLLCHGARTSRTGRRLE